MVTLRAKVEGLEALADELRSERDAWRDQAARSDEASRELRVLVRQAQTLAQAMPATTGQGGEAGGRAYATHEHAPGQTPPQDAHAAPVRDDPPVQVRASSPVFGAYWAASRDTEY